MSKRKRGREWSPAGMPHLRDRYIDLLAYGVETIRALGPDLSRTSADAVPETMRQAERDLTALPNAELYWITADMVDLIQHAACADMPDWTPTVAMPSPQGLMLWAKPVAQIAWVDDFGSTRDVSVDGIHWAMHHDGLKVGVMSRLGEHWAGVRQHVAERGWPLMEVAGFHLFDPDVTAKLTAAQATSPDAPVGVTVMSLIGTTWLLSGQQRLADVKELAVERPAGNSLRSRPRLDHVQLVDLRAYPPKPDADTPPSAVDNTKWSHRWWVGLPWGFWRPQACGPNRSQRKPVWIEPFIKGPADKPLIAKTRVNILRP